MIDARTLRDAYVYLLGRAVVNRQQQLDLAESGVTFNTVRHNPVGRVLDWVNPNLDVTNSEAWIGVDATTPALLEIPRIDDRYATAQVIDEWDEVITNVNRRTYPSHPDGTFAFVAPGSTAAIPDDAVRIELRSGKAKLLVRIELRDDPEGAVELQHRIVLRSLGEPVVADPVPVPAFDNASLIGAELFDHAEALLSSAPDISPVAAQMQAKVRDVVAALGDPDVRASVDEQLREVVIPDFRRFAVREAGVVGNNWIATTVTGNYGEDVAIRTAANYVGIWANTRHEVVYFVTASDVEGAPLDGAARYVLHFAPGTLPDDEVDAYWSLSLVDVPGFLAVDNPIGRHTFNSAHAPPLADDGSLRILLAPELRRDDPEPNWLPTPRSGGFSLTFRAYVPRERVTSGRWFPPAVRGIG